MEFIADKIPGVDSIWDALHTFIRVPAGALIAFGATGDHGLALETAGGLAGGLMALNSHATKMGSRAAINTSPEPFSNFVASITEDVSVVGGLWLALNHPWIFLGLLVLFVVLSVILLRMVWSSMKALVRRVRSWWNRGGGAGGEGRADRDDDGYDREPALRSVLLPVLGLALASMHAAACGGGGLSPDDPEDLLRQVPPDVSAVFAMDAGAVTRSPIWSGLESDVENLIPRAFGSMVDIRQDVRHVVGAMRDSAAGSTEELLIVSGTFDWPGVEALAAAGDGAIDALETVEVVRFEVRSLVAGSLDPGFAFVGSEPLVRELLAARSGGRSVLNNSRLMDLRDQVTTEPDFWMAGLLDGLEIENPFGIPLTGIDGFAVAASADEDFLAQATIRMTNVMSAQGLGSALGMARMFLLPPPVAHSLVIEVEESNLQLEITLNGTLLRDFLVAATK